MGGTSLSGGAEALDSLCRESRTRAHVRPERHQQQRLDRIGVILTHD